MKLLFLTREIEFFLLFFTIIKDIIFLINYYEKSEQNIVCKSVASVAHIMVTGITAVLNVAMIINVLQFQKKIKLTKYQLIIINISHILKVLLEVLLKCCKAQHFKNEVLPKLALNINYL